MDSSDIFSDFVGINLTFPSTDESVSYSSVEENVRWILTESDKSVRRMADG